MSDREMLEHSYKCAVALMNEFLEKLNEQRKINDELISKLKNLIEENKEYQHNTHQGI